MNIRTVGQEWVIWALVQDNVVIFATARIGQRVRQLVRAVERGLERKSHSWLSQSRDGDRGTANIMLCLPFRPAAGEIFSGLLFRHREPHF